MDVSVRPESSTQILWKIHGPIKTANIRDGLKASRFTWIFLVVLAISGCQDDELTRENQILGQWMITSIFWIEWKDGKQIDHPYEADPCMGVVKYTFDQDSIFIEPLVANKDCYSISYSVPYKLEKDVLSTNLNLVDHHTYDVKFDVRKMYWRSKETPGLALTFERL